MKIHIHPLCRGILAACTLAYTPFLAAQDEDNSRIVTIEKEYNPEVRQADRADFLPSGSTADPEKHSIRYGSGAHTYSDSRYRLGPDIMSLTQSPATQGYILGGGGNYGQMDFRAGYLFQLSEYDELNVNASFSGTDKSRTIDPPAERPTYGYSQWDNHYYRTAANIDYTHYFDQLTFGATADLGFDNFSYHRFIAAPISPSNNLGYLSKAPTANQGHRKYSLGLSLRSNEVSTLPLHFQAATSYSGFRRSHMADYAALTEHLIHTTADVYGDFNEDQAIGVRIDMDNLFYSRTYGSYTALQVNPYYNLYLSGIKLHIGGKMHYNVGRGTFLQVAPDVSAEYAFYDDYALYAEVGGGHILNDFRSLEAQNPYWMSGRLKDAHQRINTFLGIKGNVCPAFSFDLRGGYNNTKNDAVFLNLFSNLNDIAYLYTANEDTKHFYAEGKINLYFGNDIQLKLRGKTYSWDHESRAYHVAKPKNEIEAALHFRIASRLNVGINYTYIQRNRVDLPHYSIQPDASTNINDLSAAILSMDRNSFEPHEAAYLASLGGQATSVSYRMKPINNLSANLSFEVNPRLSIYAQTSNILDCEYDDFYSYRAHGINFLGGISYRF